MNKTEKCCMAFIFAGALLFVIACCLTGNMLKIIVISALLISAGYTVLMRYDTGGQPGDSDELEL